MTCRAIILGCGSSGGVPRIGGPGGRGDWGDCDPHEPRNRRRRCSLLVQRAHPQHGFHTDELTSVVVDTSPDFREQCLTSGVGRLDAVFMTHEHADQTHGIDDLRIIAITQRARVPVWFDTATCPTLEQRFAYCFTSNPETGYPAILTAHSTGHGQTVTIDGPSGPLAVTAFMQEHGPVPSLGYRFGDADAGGLAYSPDVSGIPEASWPILDGVDAWIVDALRYTVHPSHSHVAQSLGWIERSGATRGVLTNLHIDLDYRTLARTTPDHVEPAFDGMEIIFAG